MKWVYIVLIFALCGCTHFRKEKAPVSAADKAYAELLTAQLASNAKERALRAEEEKNFEALRAAFVAQLQAASDGTFMTLVAVRLGLTPSRIKDMLANYATETAAGLPGPTPQAVQAAFARFERELDETRTTNEQLKQVSAAKAAEAAVYKTVAEDAEAKRVQLEKDRQVLLETSIKTERELAAKVQAGAEQDAQVAAQALADRDEKNAQNAKLLKYCSIFAGLLGLGAIGLGWAGHWRLAIWLGAGAALSVALGYYIPLLPTWVPISVICVLVLAGAWFAWHTFTIGTFTEPPATKGDLKINYESK